MRYLGVRTSSYRTTLLLTELWSIHAVYGARKEEKFFGEQSDDIGGAFYGYPIHVRFVEEVNKS